MPKGLCDDLDETVCRFWWGPKQGSKRYLALKSWKELCRSKDLGGLGFKSFRDINLVFLSKLGWMMAKGRTYYGLRCFGGNICKATLYSLAIRRKETL